MRTASIARAALREVESKLEKFPRRQLIHTPTPFQKLERLSARLGGPAVWMKRDDLTGLALGGNKSRKLEYILADALHKRADTLITWGSLQSNWCFQSAAAAGKLGLRSILILFRTYDLEEEEDGNLFLDRLAGAEVRLVEAARGKVVSLETALGHLETAAGEVRSRGGRPYLVPVGGSLPGGSMTQPLGAIAYVRAMVELVRQAGEAKLDVGTVVHATGSGGTQAGLVVGAKALGLDLRVVGVSVSDDSASFGRLVLQICRRTEEALGFGKITGPEDVVVLDEYLGPGYGIVDGPVAGAITSALGEEAIILDPVYTAKAMVGLEDLSRRKALPPGREVVFFHTGGAPALFPHRRRLLELARLAGLTGR